METGKDLAKRIFDSLGYSVEDVPEADDERADLIVRDANHCFVIECKDKGDIALSDDQIAALERGEAVSGSDKTTQNNRISGILQKASDQLDATPVEGDTFRMIWFHSDGVDRQLIWDRAFATFYGKVNLLPHEDESSDLIQCFYFDYATSFNIPTVDALILSDGQDLQFLVNEFASNNDKLCGTELYKLFESRDAVVNPRQLEAKSRIIAFRNDGPRKDDDERLDRLKRDTGIRYHTIRFTRHTAIAASPPSTSAE